MKRALVAAAGAGLLLLLSGVNASSAGARTTPRIYHTITSTLGYAPVSLVEGCETTEVFVSSSVAMYASQPGPVNKQGLTAVSVRVTDTCATPESSTGVKPAAGGGVVVFEAEAQNGARLVVDPRLTTASVHTTMSGEDNEGKPVTVVLDARWTGTGPLEHSKALSHVLFPGEGVVSSTANDLRRTADADVSVSVASRTISGSTSEAVLEQTKSRCIEVPRPGVEGFYPCFGFPG